MQGTSLDISLSIKSSLSNRELGNPMTFPAALLLHMTRVKPQAHTRIHKTMQQLLLLRLRIHTPKLEESR